MGAMAGADALDPTTAGAPAWNTRAANRDLRINCSDPSRSRK
jgi:hypothetical protein